MLSTSSVSRTTSSRSVQKSKTESQNLSFTTTREESISQGHRLSSFFNIEEYLKDEDFDIRPKTDYTYAYSGSYCRSKPDKDVVSPNMSRRRLRGRVSMSEDLTNLTPSPYIMSPNEQNLSFSPYHNIDEQLTTSYIDESDEELMKLTDEQDFSQLYSTGKQHSGYNVARSREGMVLRSGSHLKNVSSMIQQHEYQNIDSSVYMNEHINNKLKYENYMQDRNDNRARGRPQSRSSSVSSYTGSTISLPSKEVKRTLGRQSRGREKGSREPSEKGSRKQLDQSPWSRASSVISHMLGYPLIKMYQMWTRITETTTYYESTGSDRQSDGYMTKSMMTTYTDDKPKRYSDVGTNTDDSDFLIDSLDYDLHLQTEKLYHNHESEKHLMNTSILKSGPKSGFLSWIKTLTSTQTTATDGLDETDYSDNASSCSSSSSRKVARKHVEEKGIKGFIRRSAFKAWYYTVRPGQDIVKRMFACMHQFILVDIWLLVFGQRRIGPMYLLLLIPLLLLFGPMLWHVLPGSSAISSFISPSSFLAYFSSKTETEKLPELSDIDQSNLNDKVKQIIFKLQKNQSPQLTAIDIERIVKGVISEELSALKADLLHKINDAKGNVAAWQTDQNLKFVTLKEQISSALTAQAFEKKLKEAIAKTSTQTKQDVNLARDKIRLLEEQIQSLSADIAKLRLSQFEMLGEVQNCCHNDTYFAAVIKSQINDVLSKIVAGGGGTGADSHGGFLSWLNLNYVKKDDMDIKLAELKTVINKRMDKIITHQDTSKVFAPSWRSKSVTEEYVRYIVDEAIQKFSADKTGMADYALESVGGSIISIRCSVTYYRKTALVSIFGIPLWYASNSPRTVIQPEVYPGQCWAFRGSRGVLVIQLASAVQPTGFTLEHISRLLSPAGNVDSAPKDFSVFGLMSENDPNAVHLGNYTYSQEGNPVQFFPVQAVHLDYYPIVELKILSNHGNPDYTCLYRFRVHGIPFRK